MASREISIRKVTKIIWKCTISKKIFSDNGRKRLKMVQSLWTWLNLKMISKLTMYMALFWLSRSCRSRQTWISASHWNSVAEIISLNFVDVDTRSLEIQMMETSRFLQSPQKKELKKTWLIIVGGLLYLRIIRHFVTISSSTQAASTKTNHRTSQIESTWITTLQDSVSKLLWNRMSTNNSSCPGVFSHQSIIIQTSTSTLPTKIKTTQTEPGCLLLRNLILAMYIRRFSPNSKFNLTTSCFGIYIGGVTSHLEQFLLLPQLSTSCSSQFRDFCSHWRQFGTSGTLYWWTRTTLTLRTTHLEIGFITLSFLASFKISFGQHFGSGRSSRSLTG